MRRRRPHVTPLTVPGLALLFLAASALAAPTAYTGLRPDGSSGAAPPNASGPGEPVVEVVARGLNAPVNLAFGPDGTLYYGEYKTGAVYALGPDGKPVDPGNPVIDVGEPAWGNERGFVGLAVGPDGAFYTFTTYEKPGGGGYFNRLSRWVDGEEQPLLHDLPAGDWHNAGRLHVDPRDNTLWVAYGDVNGYEVAQDPSDLRGKLLHMTAEGGPVPGNVAPDSLVYSLGHRQPFGFAVDWATGRVAVAENMDKKNDEVNLVEPGGNYGWPTCEGPCGTPQPGYTDPVLHYPKTIGPTSGAWMGGDFWFGEFNYGHLHRVFRGDDGLWYDQVAHSSPKGPIIALVPGPEGNTLYYGTWSDVLKLTFPDATPAPPSTTWEPGDPPLGADGNGTPDGASPTPTPTPAEFEGPGNGGGDGGDETPAPGLLLALVAVLAATGVLRRRDP